METITWSLDPAHSELAFKIKHLMISNVSGLFTKFDVKASTTGENFATATIEASADMNSLSTHNEQRDGHLKSGDFFEIEKYPQATFTSTKINMTGDDKFELIGDLRLKGISKEINFDVEYAGIGKDPYGNIKAGFSFTGKLKRSDFGINYNAALETGGVLIGDEVKISGEIQLIKA